MVSSAAGWSSYHLVPHHETQPPCCHNSRCSARRRVVPAYQRAPTPRRAGKNHAGPRVTLLRDQEGSIGALLRDHTQGTVQSYALNRFERGDVVRLTLHPAIRPRVYVEVGDRLNRFTMTTPIPGTVVRSFGPDTLLQVLDIRHNIVMMPVPWSAHYDLVPEQTVDVEVFGIGKRVSGRLQQLGDVVHLLKGQQVMLVTASIDDPAALPPGAMARCTIANGSVPLREYLRRMAQSTFQ